MVENHGEDYKVRPPGKNHLGLLGKYTGLFQPDLRWNRMKEESTEESIPVFKDSYVYECFAPVCVYYMHAWYPWGSEEGTGSFVTKVKIRRCRVNGNSSLLSFSFCLPAHCEVTDAHQCI